MLTALGERVRAHLLRRGDPWSNVVGVGRSLLALATALTLLFTSPSALFVEVSTGGIAAKCDGFRAAGLFCLVPQHLEWTRWLGVVALLVVASGYRPRFTGLVHAFLGYSLFLEGRLVDGGDTVCALLPLLLLPVTLTDDRRWHWSARPLPAHTTLTPREETKRLVARFGLFAIRVQVAGIYLHAGIGKLDVEEWVDGTALYYLFGNQTFGAAPWLAALLNPLLRVGAIVTLLTWSVLVLEYALGAALFMTRRRAERLLPIALAFHVGIALVHGIISFAIAMCGALVLYLRPDDQPFHLAVPAFLKRLAVTRRARSSLVRSITATLGAVATLSGCAEPAPATATGKSAQAIIGGASSSDESVVGLAVLDDLGVPQGLCSGTVLAPHLVLTARHCVADVSSPVACGDAGDGAILAVHDARRIAVVDGPPQVAAYQARGQQLVLPTDAVLCGSDVALVILDRPLTTKTAPIRMHAVPQLARTVRVVGWGLAADGTYAVRRARAGVVVAGVGPTTDPVLGAIAASELVVGESVCSGDSGGPAFDETTGAVLGVVSRGGNGESAPDGGGPAWLCTDQGEHLARNVLTRTDAFGMLVERAFAMAGETVWLEGEAAPATALLADAGPDASDAGDASDTSDAAAPPATSCSFTARRARRDGDVLGACAIAAVAVAFARRRPRRRPNSLSYFFNPRE